MKKCTMFVTVLLLNIVFTGNVFAECDEEDDGCVVVVGSQTGAEPFGGLPGTAGMYFGGSGGGSAYSDPRSQDEKEQCKKDVDALVADCIKTYSFTTTILTAACTALAVRYGGETPWRVWFTSQCVAAAGGTIYQATQWCNEQGEAKKERDC